MARLAEAEQGRYQLATVPITPSDHYQSESLITYMLVSLAFQFSSVQFGICVGLNYGLNFGCQHFRTIDLGFNRCLYPDPHPDILIQWVLG